MKRFTHTYYLFAALTFMACLAGCAQDDDLLSPGENKPEDGKTTLLLSVAMPAATKADAITLPGTAAENELKSVTLFIKQQGSAIQTYTRTNVESPVLFMLANKDVINAEIYVGANMSDGQIEAVKNATDTNPAMAISSITDITGTGGFLMTGQATGENGSATITITPHERTSAAVNLTRVMSKVLLTCDVTTANGVDYAKLSGNSKGYIKLADVHYMADNTNKKFYPFAKSNHEDPNYSIAGTRANLGENFFTSTATAETSGDRACIYNAERVKSGSTNPYTEGIYCLENTVDMSEYNVTYPKDLGVAKEVGTYVKIAAKFTPSCIDSDTDLSESAAQAKLPGGTFYTYKKAADGKKHICYSSIAQGMSLNAGSRKEDFVMHTGGWQHYETFVASPSEFTGQSNLVRNNYYIMHITSMTAPVQEKTIEVNTIKAGWSVKGKTVVEIETNN